MLEQNGVGALARLSPRLAAVLSKDLLIDFPLPRTNDGSGKSVFDPPSPLTLPLGPAVRSPQYTLNCRCQTSTITFGCEERRPAIVHALRDAPGARCHYNAPACLSLLNYDALRFLPSCLLA